MLNAHFDDEHLCRMCLDAQAQPNNIFCSACDRKPQTDDLPAGHAPVVLRDDMGHVIYEAIVDTTGDCNAQVKAMFQTLAQKGYPPIKLTFNDNKD